MPVLKSRKNSGFTGTVRLRRFLTPPLVRNVFMWEYLEPYRSGRAWIIHIPGIKRSWLRGRWNERSAKDFDDHREIQQHLLDALQARIRGYFVGEGGKIDPVDDSNLVR